MILKKLMPMGFIKDNDLGDMFYGLTDNAHSAQSYVLKLVYTIKFLPPAF